MPPTDTTTTNYIQSKRPYTEENEWTTEAGTHIELGQTYWVLPRYIDRRLRAECTRILWKPRGLLSGKHNHGDSLHDCLLVAWFTFHPEADEWEHMEGKQRKTEAYNLDFVIGSAPRVRRDRANCKTVSHTDTDDTDTQTDEPLPTPSSTTPSGFTVTDDPDSDERTNYHCPNCGEWLSRIYPTADSHENAALAYVCTERSCESYGQTLFQAAHNLCDHELRYWADAAGEYVCAQCGATRLHQ